MLIDGYQPTDDIKENKITPPKAGTGEIDINKDNLILEYKRIIIKLWELLDDIDTASDIFKPKIENYERYIVKKCKERHNYIKTNGYKLLFELLEKENKPKIEINKIKNYNCIHKERMPNDF